MLTLLSDKEINQIHSYLAELATTADNLNQILGGAQTVRFDLEQPETPKAVQVSDTPHVKSQGKTRVSSRKRKTRAVLTERKVAEIKRLLASGAKGNAVARDFKVHFSTINAIKTNRTWRHVQPAAGKPLEIVEILK
jgi:hypothetical protein